jgi:hypothetical protein
MIAYTVACTMIDFQCIDTHTTLIEDADENEGACGWIVSNTGSSCARYCVNILTTFPIKSCSEKCYSLWHIVTDLLLACNLRNKWRDLIRLSLTQHRRIIQTSAQNVSWFAYRTYKKCDALCAQTRHKCISRVASVNVAIAQEDDCFVGCSDLGKFLHRKSDGVSWCATHVLQREMI